jgi:predicted phosphodiesterase
MAVRLTRRQFVAAAAAGVTVTANLKADDAAPPKILVKPYVQPGNGSGLGKSDVKVLCWFTEQKPGEFVVEYEVPGRPVGTVTPERVALDFDKGPEPKKVEPEKPKDSEVPPEKTAPVPTEQEQHYFKYVARLNDLPFDAEILYRVKLGETVVREASFRARASAGKSVRLALVGDLANGKEQQNAIAYRISEEKPDFLVALGDITYPAGRVSQYMHFFWPTYNDTETASAAKGAPLMASLPVYPVLGNHDVAAKFPTIPDALGAYYFFHVPQNGPGTGPWTTALGSDKAAATRFRAATGDCYPALDAYSFVYGPAHIVALNSNQSGNVDQPKLRQWVEEDLKNSSARWKFVCFHNPAFSSSHQHYTEQSVRGWQTLFETCGVDVVFCGHVHNYQRSKPLKFEPTSPHRDKRGRLDGDFTIDDEFDGKKNTRPEGVIHIVAGGGGATLYGPGLDKTAVTLKKEHGDNYADYTAKMVVDRHTFVIVDLTPDSFDLRAIDVTGKMFDQMIITKLPK